MVVNFSDELLLLWKAFHVLGTGNIDMFSVVVEAQLVIAMLYSSFIVQSHDLYGPSAEPIPTAGAGDGRSSIHEARAGPDFVVSRNEYSNMDPRRISELSVGVSYSSP